MKLFVAPIQGHTDAAFRHFHAEVYGAADEYVTPFVRIEGGEPRGRDVRDIASPLNAGVPVRPQIIFKDVNEFSTLVQTVKDAGYNAVDLNIGCPFPPQMHKGRGASMIANVDCMRAVAEIISADSDMDYSVKMRLGAISPDEWKPLVRILNDVAVSHITVHPRVAKQQYKGEVNIEEFRRVVDSSCRPVIYNGDILEPVDIDRIASQFPTIQGIMIGRGLLRRPSLIAEWQTGRQWSREQRIDALHALHARLLDHYSTILCGESQILSHIKPFWEYSEGEINHKSLKLIKKSTTLTAYHTAVTTITQ